MRILTSPPAYHDPYGIGKLVKISDMKRELLFFIISVLLVRCTEQKSNARNSISICCHLTNNNNELVYVIKNDSKDNTFFLGLLSQIRPAVFIKKTNDSVWKDDTWLFYRDLLVPRDKPLELYQSPKQELKHRLEIDKPETHDFFFLVVDKIKGSQLSLKSDLLMMFDQLMCSSVFLKPEESYSDTIPLNAFKKRYSEYDLKFLFTYPSLFLYESERSYLDYYVNSFLSDSLGVKLPEKLDGYNVIYESPLNYEFIVRADR